jgi:hypothetical protein
MNLPTSVPLRAFGTAAILVLGLSGCAQQKGSRTPEDVIDSTTAQDERPEDTTHAGFVDRQAEINPTPAQVTQRRLTILHSEIAKTRVLKGRLPFTLEEILSRPEPDPNVRPQPRWLLDGWERPIRYNGDDPYELRSAGPDGVYDTADDMTSAQPT